MDAQAETTKTLTDTLKRLSNEYNVPITKVRMSISKPDAHLAYDVMNGASNIERITLHKAMNLGKMEIIKATLIRTTLNRCMDYYSRELKVSMAKLELRIYTASEEVTPTGYLFNNGKAIRPVSLDEIFKII